MKGEDSDSDSDLDYNEWDMIKSQIVESDPEDIRIRSPRTSQTTAKKTTQPLRKWGNIKLLDGNGPKPKEPSTDIAGSSRLQDVVRDPSNEPIPVAGPSWWNPAVDGPYNPIGLCRVIPSSQNSESVISDNTQGSERQEGGGAKPKRKKIRSETGVSPKKKKRQVEKENERKPHKNRKIDCTETTSYPIRNETPYREAWGDNTVVNLEYPGSNSSDILRYLESNNDRLISDIASEFRHTPASGMRLRLVLNARYIRVLANISKDTEVTEIEGFHSTSFDSGVNRYNIEEGLQDHYEQIANGVSDFVDRGSGWVLEAIVKLTVCICRTPGISGGAKCPTLPKWILDKKAVVNLDSSTSKGDDNYCLIWAVLFLTEFHEGANRNHKVTEQMRRRKLQKFPDADTNYQWPFKLEEMTRFEVQYGYRIQVVSYIKGAGLVITRNSSNAEGIPLTLLYVAGDVDDDTGHFYPVTGLNRLICTKADHGTAIVCNYCLNKFYTKKAHQEHEIMCKEFRSQSIEYPSSAKGTNIIQHKTTTRNLKQFASIILDFEALNIKVPDSEIQGDKNTTKITKMVPCSYAYLVVYGEPDPDYVPSPKVYTGEDCLEHLGRALIDEVADINKRYKLKCDLHITPEVQLAYESASKCSNCENTFDPADRKLKHRHHSHLSGEFLGILCARCNLAQRLERTYSVFSHNFTSFDSCLVVQMFVKLTRELVTNWKIKVIPSTSEKFMSITWGDLVFLDSMKFLSASLSKLVDVAKVRGPDQFVHTKAYFGEDRLDMMLRKGIFCYSWLDCFEKLADPCLPPREDFYNVLTDETVSQDDYDFAMKVWEEFGCQTVKDYLEVYVLSDVLLTSDVYFWFRDIMYKTYGLDPTKYISLPHFGYDAFLKYTKVKIELPTDPNIVLMARRAIRGGLSQVTHRYMESNIKGEEGFNPDKPEVHIFAFDINQLYADCMRGALPIGNYVWLEGEELENFDPMSTPTEGPVGHVVVCDINVPANLHRLLRYMPPCLYHKTIEFTDLSPYSKEKLIDLLGEKRANAYKSTKLVGDLLPKVNYTTTLSLLQFYIELGLDVGKAKQVLRYRQEPYIRPYVDINVEFRQRAQTEFEKFLFKLVLNSLYGRQLMDESKQCVFNLVRIDNTNDAAQEIVERKKGHYTLKHYLKQPTLVSVHPIAENLVGVKRRKPKIRLRSHVLNGLIILERAKEKMYKVWYNDFMHAFGPERLTLLATDTDCYIVALMGDDVMLRLKSIEHIFDTSNMDPNSRYKELFTLDRSSVMGLMKDEVAWKGIKRFIGLRSKVYCIENYDRSLKKALKGVLRRLKSLMSFEDFKKVLDTGEPITVTSYAIRSYLHQLYLTKSKKRAASCFDDKRFILNDGITTVPYGSIEIDESTGEFFSEEDIQLLMMAAEANGM